ncbi:MAG: translation initiation factor IF-2, partial [Wolbachia pipientis]|nr:translation initiation factor IF-2 [Wolbachia pipientis]
MNNEKDISGKKLTLQGFNKPKFGFDLSYPVISNVGATVIKKRKRKEIRELEEQYRSKLSSLTEKEQISRINAVQNAALLKEKISLEKREKEVVEEESNKKISAKKSILNTSLKETKERELNSINSI